jgi:hypothetical protein
VVARWLDALAFSSLWVAVAAGALCAASARAMGLTASAATLGLAVCGTLVVYNVDRLRDLDRDRATTPLRSAWVEAHRTWMVATTGIAGLLAVLLALEAGGRTVALLAPVLLLGLLHRRLKRFAIWKPLYITLAWVTVAVGLPAVLGTAPRYVGWTAAPLFATILANVVVSNLRDGEAVSARLGEGVPLRIARGCAVLGIVCALAAPAAVRPLGIVPLATLTALAPFHPGERYGLVTVDGALLIGALGALPLF